MMGIARTLTKRVKGTPPLLLSRLKSAWTNPRNHQILSASSTTLCVYVYAQRVQGISLSAYACVGNMIEDVGWVSITSLSDLRGGEEDWKRPVPLRRLHQLGGGEEEPIEGLVGRWSGWV